MNVLVLGAKGMAGHVIQTYLEENTPWNITGFSREQFEITEQGTWKPKITGFAKTNKPNIIINTIGILKKQATENPPLAILVNSLFPHQLAQLCTTLNIKVIHLSTDCWQDTDVYGRSKRAGEIDYPNHLTIRTSIIGPELKNGTGLFHWVMNQKKETSGFTKHIWDGVTTLELAKHITTIIEKQPPLNGIQELRTHQKITKCDLLKLINTTFLNGKLSIIPKDTEKVDKTNPHPDIEVKKNHQTQLAELKEWMTLHKDTYANY